VSISGDGGRDEQAAKDATNSNPAKVRHVSTAAIIGLAVDTGYSHR
jgi:hypothetical protein